MLALGFISYNSQANAATSPITDGSPQASYLKTTVQASHSAKGQSNQTINAQPIAISGPKIGSNVKISNTQYHVWNAPFGTDAVQTFNLSDYPDATFTVLGNALNEDNDVYTYITNHELAKGWIYSGALKKSDRVTMESITATMRRFTEMANSIVTAGNSGVDVVTLPGNMTAQIIQAPLKNVQDVNRSIVETGKSAVDVVNLPGDSLTAIVKDPIDNVNSIVTSGKSVVSNITSPISESNESVEESNLSTEDEPGEETYVPSDNGLSEDIESSVDDDTVDPQLATDVDSSDQLDQNDSEDADTTLSDNEETLTSQSTEISDVPSKEIIIQKP